jgi:hypothetical protein
MTGENILLRLASSIDGGLADLSYSKSLAQRAGPLVLKRGDEIIDSVCWTGKDGCASAFKSNLPTTLVHQITPLAQDDALWDGFTHEYIHLENYMPNYNKDSPGITIYEEKTEENDDLGTYETSEKSCVNLEFSEILSYYETTQSEQFIEFYNPTSEQILLNNCQLRYKNKLYPLEGIVEPEGYFVRLLYDFSITKNPTTKSTIELTNAFGETISKLDYYNGQKKATSYAKIGYNANGEPIWKNTFTPTPGAANIYQEYKPCEEEKVLSEETGNCVKPTTVIENTCKEGYYRNPETGRCKKIAESTTTEEKTCKEGYYLNPLTNRCKKIVTNTGAEYPLQYQNSGQGTSSFIAFTAIIALIVLVIGFVLFEFRHEIKRKSGKVFHRLFHNKIREKTEQN